MKNIIVTLIAGTFFAASVVAPAFATGPGGTIADGSVADSNSAQMPKFIPSEGLPEIDIPNRIPSADTIRERLENLDLDVILRDLAKDRLPEVVELPDRVQFPDLERVEPTEPVDVPLETAELPDSVERPEGEPDVEDVSEATMKPNASRSPVKDIVDQTKAEKASILAAHDGDRRAAKAELKSAQMRMVARIKANNGAGKAKRKR